MTTAYIIEAIDSVTGLLHGFRSASNHCSMFTPRIWNAKFFLSKKEVTTFYKNLSEGGKILDAKTKHELNLRICEVSMSAPTEVKF